MREKTRLGALLRRYRLAAGLSQEALAARAGLSARGISDLERGLKHAPRFDTLELLTNALSLSSDQHTLLLVAARPELDANVEAPPATPPAGLPLPPTQLIGREQECSRALALLCHDKVRLLTLTGPSGVGKTRLALQIAQDLSAEFNDGAVFVELAPIGDAALVPGVVAQALALREQAGTTHAEQVSVSLQDKHALLVLDNMEQIPDSASFVADLLAGCPRLSVLVTSRTCLHLRAEQELPLAPLALANAVELFRERALAVRPEREYTAPEVMAICERLDCLPLAIELAAAQVKVLSLPELREHLTNRLALLRGGARDLPARQRTMRDAIAWSYKLLTPSQKRCFRRLAVFAGGWQLPAAEAVCWAEDETTPEEAILALAGLVDASLVQVEMELAGRTRFRLLELIGDYALERLRLAGEEEPCRHRHATYYAQLAENMAPFGPRPFGAGEAQVAQEFPNARAALRWTEAQGKAELGWRLASAFGPLWFSRGQVSEAEQWFERMLTLYKQEGTQTTPAWMYAEALYTFGLILLSLGKLERAEALAQEALQLAERSHDHAEMSIAYGILGLVAQARGQLEQAATYLTESDMHATLTGVASIKGPALLNLAELIRQQGDFARATVLFGELLTRTRAFGRVWQSASIITLLGHLARQQENYTLAKANYWEALELYREFDSPTYTAWCLEGLAAALCAEGHYAQATRLCAAAATLREQAHTPLPIAEREAFEQTVATSRAALDEASFASEWKTGKFLTHIEAIDDALSDKSAQE